MTSPYITYILRPAAANSNSVWSHIISLRRVFDQLNHPPLDNKTENIRRNCYRCLQLQCYLTYWPSCCQKKNHSSRSPETHSTRQQVFGHVITVLPSAAGAKRKRRSFLLETDANELFGRHNLLLRNVETCGPAWAFFDGRTAQIGLERRSWMIFWKEERIVY